MSKAGLMRNAGFVVMVCFELVFAAAQSRVDGDPVTKVLALENIWNQAEERKDTKAKILKQWMRCSTTLWSTSTMTEASRPKPSLLRM